MQPGVFFNSALNGIDAKNRVSIPAQFRDALVKRTGGSDLFIAPARHGDYLVGFDALRMDALAAGHAARYGNDDSADRADDAFDIFDAVEPLTIDPAGRIVLSRPWQELVGIDSHALFVGAGEWFGIWKPERYLARDGLAPMKRNLIAGLMRAKGLAA